MWVGGKGHFPATLRAGKVPVLVVKKVGWAPEPVWKGLENLAPISILSRTFQPSAVLYTNHAMPVNLTVTT